MKIKKVFLILVSSSLLLACAEISKNDVAAVNRTESTGNTIKIVSPPVTPVAAIPDNLPDGIWFDSTSGLMWQKCPDGQVFNKKTESCVGSVHERPLDRAIKTAYKNEYAGYNDWRLPTHSDLLAFKNNTLIFTPTDKFHPPLYRPKYLALGSVFPESLWSSETMVYSKKMYASKACFPYVRSIGACGNSSVVAGKDKIFGTSHTGEGWTVAFLMVRDGKPNAVWDAALSYAGIDPTAKKASLKGSSSSSQSNQSNPQVALSAAKSEFILSPYPECRPYSGLLDNKDGTLTDPRSGLAWSRCDLGTQFVKGKGCVGKQKKYSWVSAMKTAREHRQGGHKNWRLPTIEEFESISDSSRNCSRYGDYHKNGTAAVDLRLLVQEYYDSAHFIHVLNVSSQYAGRENRDLTLPLRMGYAPMNHNGEDIFSGSALTRFVRQTGANDENMGLSKQLYSKYIDQVAAQAEQARIKGNADEDARLAAEKARNKKIGAAKD